MMCLNGLYLVIISTINVEETAPPFCIYCNNDTEDYKHYANDENYMKKDFL